VASTTREAHCATPRALEEGQVEQVDGLIDLNGLCGNVRSPRRSLPARYQTIEVGAQRVAREWVSKNAADTGVAAPKISEGTVILQLN
jgi:hypothetical protein